jgi:S-DNA-T family DNA segregation ATPase FtsK/SpoIIIE
MAKKEDFPLKNTYRETVSDSYDVKEDFDKPKREKKAQKPSTPKERKPVKISNPLAGFGKFIKNEKTHKIAGLFLILFSFYLLIAFTSYLFSWKTDDNIFSISIGNALIDNKLISENWMGKFGAFFSYIFIKRSFGISSYFFVMIFFLLGLKLFLNTTLIPLGKTIKYSAFAIIWLSITLSFFMRSEDLLIYGGIFGYQTTSWLFAVMGQVGAFFIIFFALVTFLIANFSIHNLWKKKDKPAYEDKEDLATIIANKYNEALQKDTPEEEPEEDGSIDFTLNTIETEETVNKTDNDFPIELTADIIEADKNSKKDEIEFVIQNTEDQELVVEPTDDSEKEHYGVGTDFDPTLDLRDYKFPSLEMLREYDQGNAAVQNEELEENKNKIIRTLNNYNIQIERIAATIGPTVTLYEIVPAPGVRISKITNLEDDIALSLAALGIRIIAPIPGKGTIGIEVPNQNPKMVSMKSVLASEAFQNSPYDLPIALGKTISNKSLIVDLAKMPHLLMAGATGQGKSVGLNAILASLLYKKHPSQLKFVLIDPKKVELTLFSKIERHYLAKLPGTEEAIITDTKKVVHTLNSLCIEMEQRYDLLKLGQVRNIKEYNAKFISRKLNPNDGHKYLPYIVLIVDEFADLIMTAGKEVETPIARIAQLARAIGIHLIVATQRPSVNIITGVIKANFPARIAFRVSSKIDSRTILDANGAEQLIGKGDMLLSNGSELIRIQCAFIDTPEVEEITEFIGSQRGYPEAFQLPEYNDEEIENKNSIDPSERDEYFVEAARIIVASQHGSTSLLQRKLKLGYNRAGRIIDQLESAGIIGPFEGSKAREVRIKDELSLEQFLKSGL